MTDQTPENTEITREPEIINSELSKDDVIKKVLTENPSHTAISMVGKVCYSIDLNEKDKVLFEQEALEAFIAGNIRGFAAEAVSAVMNRASGGRIVEMGKLIKLPGQKGRTARSKEQILTESMRSGIPTDVYSEETEDQIVAGFATPPASFWENTVWYDMTTPPDAVLVETDSQGRKIPIGPVEVKAMTPAGLQAWRETLEATANTQDAGFNEYRTGENRHNFVVRVGDINSGVNIDNEIRFINIIRGNVSGVHSETDVGSYLPEVVLRVPADAPQDELEKLADIISDEPYYHLVIERLPLTAAELDKLGAVLLIQEEKAWAGQFRPSEEVAVTNILDKYRPVVYKPVIDQSS